MESPDDSAPPPAELWRVHAAARAARAARARIDALRAAWPWTSVECAAPAADGSPLPADAGRSEPGFRRADEVD